VALANWHGQPPGLSVHWPTRFMSEQLRRGGAPAEIMTRYAAEDSRRWRD